MRIVITLFDETYISYNCKSIGIDYPNHTIDLDLIDVFGNEYTKMIPFEQITFASIYDGGIKDEKGLS